MPPHRVVFSPAMVPEALWKCERSPADRHTSPPGSWRVSLHPQRRTVGVVVKQLHQYHRLEFLPRKPVESEKGESDAEGRGTVIRRIGPICDAERLWRSAYTRPPPGGAAGLWLCALSDTGRSALHVGGPREISHTGRRGYGMQGICRTLWDPDGSANEFPADVSPHVRVAHVCQGAGGHGESVAPVETRLGRLATLKQRSRALPFMVVSEGAVSYLLAADIGSRLPPCRLSDDSAGVQDSKPVFHTSLIPVGIVKLSVPPASG